MLKEVQAAELLRRCEVLAGRELKQVRGNLRKAPTRAEAIWELLVTEAAAQLGRVEYEPPHGGPDIRLELPTGRWVSIEVTYLHRRFDDDEWRSRAVIRWMHDAEASLGPNPPEIQCFFHGDDKHPAGPRRTLPLEQDRRRFLASVEVVQFLADVSKQPARTHQQRLSEYSVTLTASPREPGSHGFCSSGGSLQEAPKVINEHAAFRALRAKVQQHKVAEPHLVCIGSDVSPVLSSKMPNSDLRLEHALSAAVEKSGELSGVLVASIEYGVTLEQSYSPVANCTTYPIAVCRHPLSETEWLFIKKLNLNRWKYTFALPRREESPQHRHRDIPGSLEISSTLRGTVKITIPASVLVDILAGRKQLLDDYGGCDDQFGQSITKRLQEGWSIVACNLQDGDIQRAEAASVVLELAPPHDDVFWSRT